MARLFLATLLGIIISLAASPAVGDELPEAGDEADQLEEGEVSEEVVDDFGAAHRQRIYETSRLDRRRAVLYSLALPGLGNFYAEQPAVGAVAMMSLVFSAMFIAFGLRNNQSGLVRFGAATGAATYGGSAAIGYLGVRRYNDRLRQSLHVDERAATPTATSSSWTIGWQWEF